MIGGVGYKSKEMEIKINSGLFKETYTNSSNKQVAKMGRTCAWFRLGFCCPLMEPEADV